MQTLALTNADYLNLVYILAAVLFILGLKMLSKVRTAARGNLTSALGMLLAISATFFYITGGTRASLIWIGAALLIGTGVGLYLALTTPMTGMPQMVALLNGFGGIASLLVACGEYVLSTPRSTVEALAVNAGVTLNLSGTEPHIVLPYDPALPKIAEILSTLHHVQSWDSLAATGLAGLIGGVTFTGSVVAWAKLQGVKWMPDAPVQFGGQKALIGVILFGSLALTTLIAVDPSAYVLNGVFLLLICLVALVLGVLLVIGIGGADMPVVIALLNSYSGLAAAMAGFVLNNAVLIITGSLVGASGLILTNIMCKAMNRSLLNVLFGGVGGVVVGAKGPQGTHHEFLPEDAAIVMEASGTVIIVPGYGMAVAQAQHAVKDLADALGQRGINVMYAIHPVAGRMPGHMNVLLAEAGVPYEQLKDLDEINPEFEQADVALVIGANDVTNPAARHDETSPIYGMPILDVDKARQVFVIKRSMNPGFAGIQNELYFMDNCGMVFGDAKKVVTELTAELSEL